MKMAKVDAPALAALKADRGSSWPDALSGTIALRSAAQPKDPDTLTLAMYQRFNAALQSRHLLYPQEDAAYSLYLELRDRPTMAPYRQDMRRELAAALQDEAQSAILDYLTASPVELHRRWSFDTRYDYYPEYLDKAAEVLGADHFMYGDINVKALYFKGLNLRLKGERDGNASLYQQAAELQHQALALDPAAAYAYNELGLLARRTRDLEASVGYFKQALALSPTWVLAETNLCGSYADMGQFALAEESCLRALQYDSAFSLAHHNLGYSLIEQNKLEAGIAALEKAIELDPDYILSHLTIADVYNATGNTQQAIASWKEALRIDPRQLLALCNIGLVLNNLGQSAEALEYFHAVLAIDSNQIGAWLNIAELHIGAGRPAEAEIALQASMRLAPELPDPYYLLARLQMVRNQADAALNALNTALEMGFKDEAMIKADKYFDLLRKQKRYKSMMSAYFPK